MNLEILWLEGGEMPAGGKKLKQLQAKGGNSSERLIKLSQHSWQSQ